MQIKSALIIFMLLQVLFVIITQLSPIILQWFTKCLLTLCIAVLFLVCSLRGSISFAAEARSGDKLIIVILYFRFPYNARDQGEQERTK